MWHHQSPFIVYGYVEMKNVERNGFLIQGLSWLSKSSIRNFWVWKIMGNEAWKDEQKADTAEKFVTNFSQVLTISPELIFSKCPTNLLWSLLFDIQIRVRPQFFLGKNLQLAILNSSFTHLLPNTKLTPPQIYNPVQ